MCPADAGVCSAWTDVAFVGPPPCFDRPPEVTGQARGSRVSPQSVDPETPISVIRRFGITTLERDLTEFTVVAHMPIGGMFNPFTGLPTVASLAVLVDDVAGRVNYDRCGQGQWTVSSELVVEMSPGAVASILSAPDEPVLASARKYFLRSAVEYSASGEPSIPLEQVLKNLEQPWPPLS